MKKVNTIFSLLFTLTLIVACPAAEPSSSPTPKSSLAPQATPSQKVQTKIMSPPAPQMSYGEVFKITYTSCLPCHNKNTLPQVIEKVKAASFAEVAGEPRSRILAELEELKAVMTDSPPFSFSSGEKELKEFFNAFPGEFHLMLERGVMPPPWAPELMKAIAWPNYKKLGVQERIKLLRFAKPFSSKYLNTGQGQAPSAPPPSLSEAEALLSESNIHFAPLVKKTNLNPSQVALGKMLYYETRLSKSGVISCNTCHNLASYGVDNRAVSIGHQSQRGTRNAPTVLNSGLNLAQFWDGRAKDLTAQAGMPILNPIEMAMPDEESVIQRLKSIPEYVEAFKNAYSNQEPNYKNMTHAIASFEETLVTPSRFDQFLAGNQNSLTEIEKKGLRRFIDTGCIACHDGPGLGGRSYQLFGVASPYQHQKDEGRFGFTKNKADKFMVKVPLLRNIDKTYPYFHDGKIWDLKDAVDIMGKTELGKTFSTTELEELVAFLKSLTGEVPKDAKILPTLPASSKDTPQPES